MNIRPPQFDIWFWLLVVWSFLVPYFYDAGHARSCSERGQVTFYTITSWWTDDEITTFACVPIKGGLNNEIH
jgi:hypothetical protein